MATQAGIIQLSCPGAAPPVQPTGFYVSLTNWANPVQAGAAVIWDDVRHDAGQNFDATSGAFVAPQDGFYNFNVGYSDNKRGAFWILIDGERANFMIDNLAFQDSSHATLGFNINLKAGQMVQVASYEACSVYGNYQNSNGILTRSFFSGGMMY